jgi:E3 ubiquitin-protein ligase RNF14
VVPLDFGWKSAGSHPRRIKHPAPTLLVEKLTLFDDKTRLERFSQTNHACEVCLSSIKGAKCISLACGHVFCRACLVDFWGLCISEGDVDRLGCPDPGCVKQGIKTSEEDVQRVVSSEEVARWKWLKEKKELENGTLLMYWLFWC